MHPILIELGKFRIYSYGFMLALSFFIGIWLAARRAGKRGIRKEIIYDLSIVLIIAAVVGSRTLYILTHREHYRSIIDIFALWQGGATYYGGLILALAGAVVFLRRKRVPFFRIADVCSPSIVLGVFVTRIGCFLSGCCFGLPTDSVFGVAFPPNCPAGYTFGGTHIHPTQLYSSFYGLLIFAVLLAVDRKRTYDGFVFALLCVFYGAGRIAVDFVRYYEDSATIRGFLTVSQLLSFLLVIAGISLLFVLRGRKEGTGEIRSP